MTLSSILDSYNLFKSLILPLLYQTSRTHNHLLGGWGGISIFTEAKKSAYYNIEFHVRVENTHKIYTVNYSWWCIQKKITCSQQSSCESDFYVILLCPQPYFTINTRGFVRPIPTFLHLRHFPRGDKSLRAFALLQWARKCFNFDECTEKYISTQLNLNIIVTVILNSNLCN